MATKDYSISPPFAKDTNDQYRNLNLNQNHKCSDGFLIYSKSTTSDDKKVATIGSANDGFNEGRKNSKLFSNDSRDSSLKLFNLHGVKEKESSNTTKLNNGDSLLSLTIEAYENSMQHLTSDEKSCTQENGMKKEYKKFKSMKQIWEEKKAAAIKSSFEFPRQQEQIDPGVPEVAQFKSSQRLLNPEVPQPSSSTDLGNPSPSSNPWHPANINRPLSLRRFRQQNQRSQQFEEQQIMYPADVAFSREGNLSLLFHPIDDRETLYNVFSISSVTPDSVSCRSCDFILRKLRKNKSKKNKIISPKWNIRNGLFFTSDPRSGHLADCKGITAEKKNNECYKNYFYQYLKQETSEFENAEDLVNNYIHFTGGVIGSLNESRKEKLKNNLWSTYLKSKTPTTLKKPPTRAHGSGTQN